MGRYVLAIDQGTTSSRALLFAEDYRVAALAQEEFPQHYPASGWVEHDPEDIWRTTLATARAALAKAGASAADVVAIGISNQRETSIVWDRATGRPIHNAIVWQDRRTADVCQELAAAGARGDGHRQDGAAARPLFLGDQDRLDPRSRRRRTRESRARRARLRHHRDLPAVAADRRPRARDRRDECLAHLPVRHPHRRVGRRAARSSFACRARCCPRCATTPPSSARPRPSYLGAPIPIRGMAGDQQAATIGQACFAPGMIKSTYGTGCFAVRNTGGKAIPSRNRLLTTIAYQLAGERTYALEGSIFIAGAARAVAARRAPRHPERRCRGPHGAGGGPEPERHAGAGLRRARCALLGPRLPRRALWADAQHRPQRAGAGRARRGVLPDERPARRHARRLARRGRAPSCASTAAWRRPTGPCSGWPTSSTRRSTGRRCWRRRRWGRRISPGLQSGFYPEPDASSPSAGRSIGALAPSLAAPERARLLAPGTTPCARLSTTLRSAVAASG